MAYAPAPPPVPRFPQEPRLSVAKQLSRRFQERHVMIFATEGIQFSHICPKSAVICARAAEVPTIAINRASAIGRENISYSPSPFGQNQGRQT
jgi:hypothetical protein